MRYRSLPGPASGETPSGLAWAASGFASSRSSSNSLQWPRRAVAASLVTTPVPYAMVHRLSVPAMGAAPFPSTVAVAGPPLGILRAASPRAGSIRILLLGRTGVREPAPSPRLHLRLIIGVGGKEAEAAEEGPGRARRMADLYEVRVLLPIRLAQMSANLSTSSAAARTDAGCWKKVPWRRLAACVSPVFTTSAGADSHSAAEEVALSRP